MKKLVLSPNACAKFVWETSIFTVPNALQTGVSAWILKYQVRLVSGWWPKSHLCYVDVLSSGLWFGYTVTHPIGSPTHTRRKDRMSYSHEEFVIDLTQVTSSTSPAAPVSPFQLSLLCILLIISVTSLKFYMSLKLKSRGPRSSWQQRRPEEIPTSQNTSEVLSMNSFALL